ncbi:MAG: complex I NDUFA9 subunit family protein [Thermodesulfovibrionales bacterium]|jgi:NADH dehydrogenase
MVRKFFVAGGTGFIGSRLLNALSGKGIPCRCLARSPRSATLCSLEGVETAQGDITDRESLRGKLDGCDLVVHLVGIIEEEGRNTFDAVHVKGTENLVDEALKAGVKHIFYQSALGASLSSEAKYHRTKAEAEEIVRSSGIPCTIFRPSLVVGKGDGFTERLRELISLGPVITVPGTGNTRFQPLYVEDWVRCFFAVFSDAAENRGEGCSVYEFGGPEQLSYNEIILQLMEALGKNKPLIHIPIALVRAGIPFQGISQAIGRLTGREIPRVSREQLSLLQRDNICAGDSVEKQFGFAPLRYREALRLFISLPEA